jgi:hypothetical protein
VGRARIRRLEIDELVVRRIRVIEQITPPLASETGGVIGEPAPVVESGEGAQSTGT